MRPVSGGKPGDGKAAGGLRLAGRIHVVDDDPSFLTAIERRLTHAGYEVATYATAQQLLDNLPTETEASCLLIDVRMPGLDGPALQQRLGELGSTMPIIFMTGRADTPVVVKAMKAGAHDFLIKPVASDELFRAIEKALRHHQVSRDQESRLSGIRDRIAKLTPRERQVFDLIIRGKINKQAARELGTSERTIKAHRQRVMEKMQVRSLAELVSLAERIGIVG